MKKFQTIGLYAKHLTPEIKKTLKILADFLVSAQRNVLISNECSSFLKNGKTCKNIEKNCDLLIAIGGDGSLLSAARNAAAAGVPVLGINRGQLGFLTDIKPDEIATKLKPILDGQFIEGKRFLLKAQIAGKKTSCSALNEIVLGSRHSAAMLDFEIYVDNQFMCSQRSDGLIIATPTGSTAYALSGGGPILHPALDAIVLVPMFSHSLTQRPIVIHGNSEIKIIVGKNLSKSVQISGDSHTYLDVHADDEIIIQKLKKQLRLIHPLNYDYFDALRSKLYWGRKIVISQP